MKVRGINGMTLGELIRHVKAGGRFVVFQFCVGAVVTNFAWPSAVYFVRPGDRPASKGFFPSLLTLLLGWWAIPLGPIKAWRTLRDNLAGGRDVTAEVLRMLMHAEEQPQGHRPPAFDARHPARPHAA